MLRGRSAAAREGTDLETEKRRGKVNFKSVVLDPERPRLSTEDEQQEKGEEDERDRRNVRRSKKEGESYTRSVQFIRVAFDFNSSSIFRLLW